MTIDASNKLLDDELVSELDRFQGIIGFKVQVPASKRILLQHNQNELFPAGSVIKLPVLLELFRQVIEDGLDIDEVCRVTDEFRIGGSGILSSLSDQITLTLMDLAKLMIQISDNTAANVLVHRLGKEKINHFMQRMGACHTRLLQEQISSASFTDPDSLAITTPSDMNALFIQLVDQTILTSKACQDILNLLKRSTNKNRICRFLPYRPDITIHHKTGTLFGVYNDVGLVRFNCGDFVISALTKGVPSSEDPRASNDAELLIARVSLQTFKQLSTV